MKSLLYDDEYDDTYDDLGDEGNLEPTLEEVRCTALPSSSSSLFIISSPLLISSLSSPLLTSTLSPRSSDQTRTGSGRAAIGLKRRRAVGKTRDHLRRRAQNRAGQEGQAKVR